jgi:DNA-binding XRE family transcriptional regulator
MTKLKNVREKKLLSREELAVNADVSLKTICSAENGRGVTLTTVKKLAKGMKVKPEELV